MFNCWNTLNIPFSRPAHVHAEKMGAAHAINMPPHAYCIGFWLQPNSKKVEVCDSTGKFWNSCIEWPLPACDPYFAKESIAWAWTLDLWVKKQHAGLIYNAFANSASHHASRWLFNSWFENIFFLPFSFCSLNFCKRRQIWMRWAWRKT